MSGDAGWLAFVCPRHAGESGAGGAETLILQLARRAAAAGRSVSFLTTCATDHFTWANTLPPGRRTEEGVETHFFPVDESRDASAYHAAYERINRGGAISPETETLWLRNSVHSSALIAHLRDSGDRYDRILAGPYLFGLVLDAAAARPDRFLLIPCLHDEPVARLPVIRNLFDSVRGCLFNAEPERDLALRLHGFPPERGRIVGIGMTPFDADPAAFPAAHNLRAPYVFYAGRREGGKSAPLLADYVHAFRRRTGRDLRLVSCGSGILEARDFTLDLGFVSERKKREAMAGAVAFAHPSRMESLSIALLESFLAETPGLVRAQCETLRWQCARSGGGLWWRWYPDFEAELVRLLDDKRLRDALGRQGRAFVQREYAWPAVERRLLDAADHL